MRKFHNFSCKFCQQKKPRALSCGTEYTLLSENRFLHFCVITPTTMGRHPGEHLAILYLCIILHRLNRYCISVSYCCIVLLYRLNRYCIAVSYCCIVFPYRIAVSYYCIMGLRRPCRLICISLRRPLRNISFALQKFFRRIFLEEIF